MNVARVVEPVTVTPSIDRPGHWRVYTAQWLPRQVESIWDFFCDAHNLEQLTPDLLNFNILTPAPIKMDAGTIIDYRLKIRGVPVKWKTEIDEWDPPHRFADNQVKGPYRTWYHIHTFDPQVRDGITGTICADEVFYKPPGGPLRNIVNAIAVERDVKAIFEYRQKVMAELFGEVEDEKSAAQFTGPGADDGASSNTQATA